MIDRIKHTLKNNSYIRKYYRLFKSGSIDLKPLKKSISGRNNIIEIHNSVLFCNSEILINGNNNSIRIDKSCAFNNFKFKIKGNNHVITLSQNVTFGRGGVIWLEDNGCMIRIGSNSSFEESHIAVTENNSKLSIGNDCMFAYGIDIRTGDSHSIIDHETGKRINFAEDVFIGNHVWVAAHASILKGSQISDNSIVATRSVVTKKFYQENILIGGIPARILKNNVNWDRARL